MSLTSLLQTDEVRRRFRDAFEKPSMDAAPPIQAPVITDRPSHVGAAFDYLLRFHLRRLNPEVVAGRTWTAETAAELLSNAEREKALETIRRAKEARDAYVASGKLTQTLLEAELHLARLDLVARTRRTGSIDITGIDPVTEADVDDLRQLQEIIPDDPFQASDLCLLNPTFGKASGLVGGADADLLLDNTLIEIKTVNKPIFRRDMFDQLLGYYTLHVIGGIGEIEPKPTIRSIGVYFSRHAHLHVVPLDEVIDRSTYPDFVEWFARYALSQSLN